eukprot:CFRG2857T1
MSDDGRIKRHKKAHKSKSSSKKSANGEKRHKVKDEEQISSADYFAKSTEFRLWLHEEYDIHFDDLDSRKAKKKFKVFVQDYNDGYLDKKYYKGVHGNELETSARTSYKWGFAKNLDNRAMSSLRDDIDADTYKKDMLKGDSKRGTSSGSGVTGMGFAERNRTIGPSRGPPSHTESSLKHHARDDKDRDYNKMNNYNRRVEDERIERKANRPSSTFDKKVEQRAERTALKRAREYSAEPVEGNPYEEYNSTNRKSRTEERRPFVSAARAKKNEERQEKLSAYKQKEESTMTMFKEMAKRFE